ncbi:glycoside hydrolase family 18 protein [Pusillimonas noertemannii]|uniref:glycoside hydrolase family 18 protein n=1 Tax=Pusillimonas noertemannii TaxID=305977 RepID=UPI0003141232|nr:glycoside hydrolase family 18 protein [Pusillimonas noertemannii]
MRLFLAYLSALFLLAGCGGTRDETPAPPAPIAAAWFYLSDDHDYFNIPAEWQEIAFDKVDVLYVGPAGIQEHNQFGLFESAQTGPLRHRFEWLVDRARHDNPDIKIVISQWWGNGQGIWGKPLSALNGDEAALDSYVQSVADFIGYYQSYAGGRYALDGFDIDYEDNNVTADFPALAHKLKDTLQALSSEYGKPLRLTLSPAEGEYLNPDSLSPFDYINMQSYAGGMDIPPEAFFQEGVPASKILYGICPETNCDTHGEEEVLATYHHYGLAGVHLWRLNSDNHAYEGQVQQRIYSALHPPH